MHAATSSVKKGETLIDTAMTLNAMRADAIVIRHASSRGAADCRKGRLPGAQRRDGQHEHPTQALLDALTIRHALGLPKGSDLNGLRVTICGDILHSRVARSNILSLTALGCEVSVARRPR
jgi:aspartate carbamoyltransferase catalytic subunit